jgi:hypothetical protein
LIHNFCEHDYYTNEKEQEKEEEKLSSKLLLLSSNELILLKKIKALTTADKKTAACSFPVEMNHPNRGLLIKIIDTLITQPSNSIYRFWLSSCVEAFLRRATFEEQIFIASTPLLGFLLEEILNNTRQLPQEEKEQQQSTTSSSNLQSAFDLLGEMTKKNHTTLYFFHQKLAKTKQFVFFMGKLERKQPMYLFEGVFILFDKRLM